MRPRNMLSLFTSVCAAAVIAACGVTSTGGAPNADTTNRPNPLVEAPSTSPTATLSLQHEAGWQLESFVDGDAISMVLDGTALTMLFGADKTVGGNGGCNTFGGNYTTNGTALSISDISSTEIACSDQINQQEQAFFESLTRVASYQIEDARLILSDANNNRLVTLVPATQKTAQLQHEAGWQIESFIDGEVASSVLNGTNLTMVFGVDGMVSGDGGCNMFRGSYTADDATLSFGPLAATKKACTTEIDSQELRFLEALSRVTTYQIEGTRLSLSDASGNTLLTLNAQ